MTTTISSNRCTNDYNQLQTDFAIQVAWAKDSRDATSADRQAELSQFERIFTRGENLFSDIRDTGSAKTDKKIKDLWCGALGLILDTEKEIQHRGGDKSALVNKLLREYDAVFPNEFKNFLEARL